MAAPPVLEEGERSDARRKDWWCGQSRRVFCAVFEKHQQLLHRHAPSFIRHVLDAFRQGTLSAAEAADQLGLSRSRLYALATEYLRACAQNRAHLWMPGGSGGDHSAPWPQPVLDLLKKRLGCSPPCPYSFVASEALRLHSFKLDRAQVRRWAIAKMAHARPVPTEVCTARAPLAALSDRRTLAIGCLASSLVSPLPASTSRCSICSMTAAASSSALNFTTGNCSCPTSISCPPPSWPTAGPCNSTWITTASFSRKPRGPDPIGLGAQVL